MSEARTERPLGVIFLTCPVEDGRRILQSVRQRWGGHRFTVYLRDEHREALAVELEGMELLRDKPTGSRLGFLRSLRARRYDLAVMAWQGHPEFNRMKVVGMFSGAAERHVYNENFDSFTIESGKNPIWIQHLKWRLGALGRGPGAAPLRTLVQLYRNTLGALLGFLRVAALFGWLRVRRVLAG